MGAPAFWTGIEEFDRQVRESRSLLETYETDIFNAKTRGAISLGSVRQKSTVGTFSNWDRLVNKTLFRDPDTNTTTTDQYMGQYLRKNIKFGMRWGPDVYDTSTGDWKGISMSEMGTQRGRQIASENVGFRAQLAVSSLVGAFSVTDLSGLTSKIALTTGTPAAANKMSLSALATAQALLGDQWQSPRTWVMHSKPFHDLVQLNIANANQLFSLGTLNLFEFMGKNILVTDNPQLVFTANNQTLKQYRTLGLKAGACSVQSAGEFRSFTEPITGMTNINIRTQAQDAGVINVMNMEYKLTAAPTAYDTLAAAASWDTAPTTVNVRDYMGVQLITN